MLISCIICVVSVSPPKTGNSNCIEFQSVALGAGNGVKEGNCNNSHPLKVVGRYSPAGIVRYFQLSAMYNPKTIH